MVDSDDGDDDDDILSSCSASAAAAGDMGHRFDHHFSHGNYLQQQ